MNWMHRLLFYLSLCWPLAVMAQEPQLIDQTVARVDGTAITLSELEEAVRRRMIANPQDMPPDLDQIREEELQALIDETLLYQAALKQGIAPSEAAVARQVEETVGELQERYGSRAALEAALLKTNTTLGALKRRFAEIEERKMAIAAAVQRRFFVSEAEAEAFAEEMRARGEPVEAWRLRQILIECPPDASAAHEEAARERADDAFYELQNGADFAQTAMLLSEHEPTREDGGDLGWIGAGTMLEPLEEAAQALGPGEFSAIISTNQGFQILFMEDKRTARSVLFGKKFHETRERWVDDLRRTEHVEILEAALPQGRTASN